ncbi:50S ribosomal protein L9 [Candidatus Nardonella dryophthoridicola]|uniref:Large ribosomal subunit protein bL9 n=1 Tax=endosymbiont of Metamasius hemipterus TaxID=204627 RepID=A0ABT0TWB5_9GAMM|nr:50S ribosomal protein L9 [Candidatus Nardonella dryophthoridicola]MCM0158285.1 50S ribosomal protein L9 [endosymbiont of Metamasius hemipterus]
MKVIILKSINKLNNSKDIINVKDGYARNFLIPYGYAIIANKNNINSYKNKIIEKENIIKNKEKYYEYIINEIIKINDNNIIIYSRSKNNKLFGSIKEIDIINYFNNINKKINLKKKIFYLKIQ